MSTTIHAAVNPPSSNCNTTAAAPATSLPSTSVAPGIVEHLSFKNRLQEFAQRASLPVPSYETVNISGPSHVPQFRSSVDVDGQTYTSLNAYSNKKAAEQDAAKVALEGIYKKIKDSVSKKTTIYGFPPIFQDKVFCKSILHEFAAKMNMEMPKYETVKLEGLVPLFVTSLTFNGVKHVGDPGVNKKEAEQLAARTAILSILVDSGLGMQLSEVVISKAKLFSIVHEHIHANECPPLPSVQPNVEPTLQTSSIKREGQPISQTDFSTGNNKGGLEGGDQANNLIGNVVFGNLEGQSNAVASHEVRNPEIGTISSGVPLPTKIVPPNVVSGVVEPETWTFSRDVSLPVLYPSLEEQYPSNASPCGRKRKQKKKKKANKKAKQSDTATQVSELPLNQGLM